MTGLILAGGENRRLPVLKAFLTIEERPIIERSLEILQRVLGRVVISTNQPEQYFRLGVPLIGDVIRERGPLTGIVSALTATGVCALFVVACDMPFINEELIRYMVDVWNRNRDTAAVIPVFEGKEEPLFGIYTDTVTGIGETMIRHGERGIQALLKTVPVQYISEEEVRAVDPRGDSFVNINTMADYERIGGAPCLA